jgi:hypothetical protein
MARALEGGNRLSRPQLAKLVVAQGIVGTEIETIPMFMTAELELVIVSGGLMGRRRRMPWSTRSSASASL